MNRREFLKSLAAIGTALAIDPSALAKVSDTEIDTAWNAISASPKIFYVGSEGTLSSSFGIEYHTTRQSLFWLPDVPKEKLALIEYIEANDVVECHIENLFYAESDEEEVHTWRERMETNADVVEDVISDLERWLTEWPDDAEWEHADLNGYSGRGDALQFFESQVDIKKLLNIAIIYGDHPGSTYYAAELKIDIAEANAIAEAQGLPIRFDWDEA
jgi:hypothetical protein